MDAVFRHGMYTHSPTTTFKDLELGEKSEIPIVLDEEEDKESSPPTTPLSEPPIEAPSLLSSRHFGKRIKNVPDTA